MAGLPPCLIVETATISCNVVIMLGLLLLLFSLRVSCTQQTHIPLGNSLIRQVFETSIMYTTDRNVSFGVFPVYQVIASLSHTCYVVKILMKIHGRHRPSLVHANKRETHKRGILTPTRSPPHTPNNYKDSKFLYQIAFLPFFSCHLLQQELWRSHLGIHKRLHLHLRPGKVLLPPSSHPFEDQRNTAE